MGWNSPVKKPSFEFSSEKNFYIFADLMNGVIFLFLVTWSSLFSALDNETWMQNSSPPIPFILWKTQILIIKEALSNIYEWSRGGHHKFLDSMGRINKAVWKSCWPLMSSVGRSVLFKTIADCSENRSGVHKNFAQQIKSTKRIFRFENYPGLTFSSGR